MHNTETLNFKVTLDAIFWKKIPEYSILVDNIVKSNGLLVNKGVTVVEFSCELEHGPHVIAVRLSNKDWTDTLIENGEIVADMLLTVSEIQIDTIDLGELKYQGIFYLDSPQMFQGQEIQDLPGCTSMGWNGQYELKFSSPYYLWLLENL